MFIYRVNLALFGEGAGEGTSAAAGQESGEETAAVAEQTEVKTTSNTLEDKRKAYRALMDGEYKDFYTEDTQRMINRRFKETKALEAELEALRPLRDTLTDRYGESDIPKLIEKVNNDTNFWSEAASEAGFEDVDKYREYQRIKRENAAFSKAHEDEAQRRYTEQRTKAWLDEAEQMKAKYPGFDFEKELEDQHFLRSIQNGVPMEVFYRGKHYDELMSDSAIKVEKAVAENIRAKGVRPSENGASSQGGYDIASNVSSLTNEQRLELVKKARAGENIKL